MPGIGGKICCGFLLCCVLLTGGLPAQAADGQETLETQTGETEGELLGDTEKKLLWEIGERLSSGELDSPEKIGDALRDAEERLGITLTKEQRERITQVAGALNGLPLDTEALLSAAQELYGKYGSALSENLDELIEEQIAEPVKEAFLESIKNVVKDFFRQMGEALRRFFSGIFSG